jgi:hypothetical protein
VSCLPYSVFQVIRVGIAESFCGVSEGFWQPLGIATKEWLPNHFDYSRSTALRPESPISTRPR